MYLDLNLATFQYIDGFGLLFLLKKVWIGNDYFHLKFFATFGSVVGLLITASFGTVLGLPVTVGLQVNSRQRWALY